MRWTKSWMALLVWGGAISVGGQDRLEAPEPVPPELTKLCDVMEETKARIFMEIQEIAESLFDRPLDGAEAREFLDSWDCPGLEPFKLELLDADKNSVASRDTENGEPVTWPAVGDSNWREMQETEEPVVASFFTGTNKLLMGEILVPLFENQGESKGALRLTFSAQPVLRRWIQDVEPAAGHSFFVLTTEGRTVYAANPDAINFQGLIQRMANEPSGQIRTSAIKKDPVDLEKRTLDWLQCTLTDAPWILVMESRQAFGRDPENPLTGRWVGAYSRREKRAGRELESMEESRGGGQLNVLILQDGTSCALLGLGGSQERSARGVIIGDSISAAEVRSVSNEQVAVWYWQGEYDREKDSISGSLNGNASDVVESWSYFLKRAEAGPEPR